MRFFKQRKTTFMFDVRHSLSLPSTTMMNKASYAARSLSRVSSAPQLQVRRTFFGWFGASPQSPLTAEIEETLERAFQPSFLKVLDESDKFYS
jgi:hypothetical protein